MKSKGTTKSEYPHLSCYWLVGVNGIKLSAYEVSGLNEVQKSVHYRSGADFGGALGMQPANTEPGQLTIKWGIISSDEPGAFIYHLWKEELKPKKEKLNTWPPSKKKKIKVNIEVILLDENKNEIMQWICHNCTPQEYRGPEFKSYESAIAMQTLIVKFESIESRVINWLPPKVDWGSSKNPQSTLEISRQY